VRPNGNCLSGFSKMATSNALTLDWLALRPHAMPFSRPGCETYFDTHESALIQQAHVNSLTYGALGSSLTVEVGQ
jgi:hypothetical protein